MSRIDDLIADLCPDGAPHLALAELATRITDGSHAPPKGGNGENLYPMISAKNITGGRINYVDARMLSREDYEVENRRTCVAKGDLLLTIVGAIGRVAVVNTDNPMVFQRSVCVIKLDCSRVISMFVRYVLESSQLQRRIHAQANGAAQKGIYLQQVEKIRIPVPPLEVQREIVRILDHFTALEAELEAELEARWVQQAFYWDTLLTPRACWQKLTIGNVAQVFDGPHATPKKTEVGPWYLSISSLKNGRFDLTESAHLSDDDLPTWTRRVAPRRGDTLFSYETRLGQAALWNSDEPAALGRRMGLLRPDKSVIDPQFLTLAYLGPQFQSVIRAKTVSGSTVDRIPIAHMASWELMVPPLDEQRRIASTIDSFDALVNDLSFGLPAELAARRKQYEHYRDRLLTFEERPA